MVEIGVRNFRVPAGAHADEHGISLQARFPQHGDKQGRFVPANTVFFAKSRFDVVWLKARPVFFRGQTHVADFIGDMIKDGLDAGCLIGHAGRQGFHFLLHLLVRGLEVWLAQIPIPFGNRFPIARGADQQALQSHFVRRHGRFVKHARNMVDLPVMDGAAIGVGRCCVFDRAGNLIAQGDALQRPFPRGMDFVRDVPDITGAFKDIFVGEFARNNGALNGLAGDGMDDIANFHLGNVHPQEPVVGVIDIHLHLAVIDRLLGIGGHVHRGQFAVGMDDLQLDHFFLGVGQNETQRNGAVVALAFFG